jgi:hypothetical protein
MQNINPLFILQPLLSIIICVALMFYWHKKRHFHLNVWLYSLVAYVIAIALKYAVQLPTINYVIGSGDVVLGLYYGLQTVVFEVGLAYVLTRYAIKRGKMDRRDAEAYGSGLGFWENVGLLGILSLINYVAYYAILSSGGSLADTLYTQLSQAAPDLFASDATALGLVGLGLVERASSLMVHVAWGYLCVMAVLYRKKYLFAIALPMGLIDFLVPFASDMGLVLFEVVIFVLAVASVFVAWAATRKLGQDTQTVPPQPTQTQMPGTI